MVDVSSYAVDRTLDQISETLNRFYNNSTYTNGATNGLIHIAHLLNAH